MKIVGVTAIGTYYSPWFPYCLASIYGACDEIVVVNNGYDRTFTRLQPLGQVHGDIRHIDSLGKVKEITDVDPGELRHPRPLGTQRAANLRRTQGGEGEWYDVRGLNLTAANEAATDMGADWILKIDSDEVCYSDLRRGALEANIGTWLFHQTEFAGEVGPDFGFEADPPPASPYIDTVQTYQGYRDVWYLGAGAIAGLAVDRRPTDLFHCAHLREANPWWLSREEKFEHFYGRVLWRLYTNDYGYVNDEVRQEARGKAEVMLNRAKGPSKPAPLVCYYEDPLDYVKR